jgi:hypothetical protein
VIRVLPSRTRTVVPVGDGCRPVPVCQDSGLADVAVEGAPGLVQLLRCGGASLRLLSFDAVNERDVLWHVLLLLCEMLSI